MNPSDMFLKRALIKKGLPIHLIWFVTATCNLSCSHCFYHENLNGKKDELTLDEIDKITANMSPALAICLTGGEPFLRHDLSAIVDLICKRKLTKNLTLCSNGFATDRVVNIVKTITKNWPDVSFSVGISLDGFQETHDRLRGVLGSYRKALQTLEALSQLAKSIKNFSFGAQTTIHGDTHEEVPLLRLELMKRFGIKPGFTLIRGDAKDPKLKTVSPHRYRELIRANEKDVQTLKQKSLFDVLVGEREILGHKMAYETIISNRRTYDCYGGSLMGIISETGDVFPCEMLKNSLFGNLRQVEYDLNALWTNEAADRIRKHIKHRLCHCTYECQYTCNTLYNIRYWPFFIKAVIRSLF